LFGQALGLNDSRTFYDLRSFLDLILAALPVQPVGGPQGLKLRQVLLDTLGSTRALLFIDDFEYLNSESAIAILEFLASACASTRVIISTREHIAAKGIKAVEIGELDPQSALELFVRRANGIGLNDAPLISVICDRLGGHPLALTVVAARVGELRLEQIATRLSQSGLESESKTEEEEITSQVWASLDLSYDRLSVDEKRAFALMGAFSSPVLPEYLQVLMGVQNGATILRALAQRSLCYQRGAGHALIPIVARYAIQKYEASEGSIGDLHVTLALFLKARSLERRSMDDTAETFYKRDDVLKALLASSDHLFEAAYRYGIREAAPALKSEIEAFYDHIVRLGLWSEARRKARQMVDLARIQGDRTLEAEWLLNLGVRYQDIGEYEASETLYRQALDVLAELGDVDGMATARYQLGMIAQQRGDLQTARRLYAEKETTGAALRQMGIAARDAGDYVGALSYFNRSLRLEEVNSSKIGISNSLHQIGNLALLQGDLAKASDLFRKSLALAEELMDKESMLVSLGSLASVDEAEGYREEAMKGYQRCLELAEEVRDKKTRAGITHNLANLYQLEGHFSSARKLFELSLDLETQMGNSRGMARTLTALAKISRERQQYSEALQMCNEAARLATEVADSRVLAEARTEAGETLFAEGRLKDALSSLIEGYRILKLTDDRLGVNKVVVTLVRVRKAMGFAMFSEAVHDVVSPDRADRSVTATLLGRLFERWREGRPLPLEMTLAEDLAAAERREQRRAQAVADPRGMMFLMELRHLHEFMLQERIKDKTETDDKWILKHLDEFHCFSVEDVKGEHNRLAMLLGRTDLIIH
jgi:tetratricopeptide (TPR) repeat protein